MQYRIDKYGNQLSVLGFGCMRFQRKAGAIDMEEAEREIMTAYRSGVNYYDTAYIYLDSESSIGEIFERNGIRKDIHIATKLPHYLIKSIAGIEKLFQEELKRLRTDYVDYYLMHMLNDADTWKRLVDMGIGQWIEEKKKSGAIRQIGFSYHGNCDMFCKVIDAYDWDFCQIQYNYLDEHSQAGRRGLHHAYRKGIPVIIMEPLRGGKLVKHLPEAAKKIFREYTPSHTPAQWAFRWLWDQKEVTVVLSGMNSNEMVLDNIKTASETRIGTLTDADRNMLSRVVQAIHAGMKVGCTGCGYCMPCPRGVDIPGTFAAWNRYHAENRFSGFREYMMCTALRKNTASASQCIGCGKCEKHCPQGISIREMLKGAQKDLETPVYKAAKKAAGWFVHF